MALPAKPKWPPVDPHAPSYVCFVCRRGFATSIDYERHRPVNRSNTGFTCLPPIVPTPKE